MRGSITKTVGARVVVKLDLGGKTQTLTYPYGKAVHNNTGVNLNIHLRSPVPRNATYHGAVTLLVERRSPKDSGLVTVDTLAVAPPARHR